MTTPKKAAKGAKAAINFRMGHGLRKKKKGNKEIYTHPTA